MMLPAPLSSLFSKVQATTSSEDNLEEGGSNTASSYGA